MGRRRLQQKGDLRVIGGYWRVRWREDQIKGDRTGKYAWSRFHDVGPATGPCKMTRKEAQRAVWENYLSRLDQNMRAPQSILTVREFVDRRFLPEHVTLLKTGGRTHYEAVLKYVLEGIPEERARRSGVKMVRDAHGHLHWPEETGRRRFGLGDSRLRDVDHEDVQRLVSEAIERGYSVQTARHIKNCVSAIFQFAEEIRWFSGRNPARFVRLPELTRRPVRVLSFDELKTLLAGLPPMARAMVLCASLTSMNVAEVCGLRWKRVNLTAEAVIVDGESLPAHHLAVREQWYLGQWGSVKTASRRRILPMPTVLVEALADLLKRGSEPVSRGAHNPESWVQLPAPLPDSPVFAGKSGRPVDQSAVLNRHVRKAAAAIGADKLGWHDLRRTFATLADQLGMTLGERQALMGHARAAMTMAYTHTPSELAIAALERLGEKVKGAVN